MQAPMIIVLIFFFGLCDVADSYMHILLVYMSV